MSLDDLLKKIESRKCVITPSNDFLKEFLYHFGTHILELNGLPTAPYIMDFMEYNIEEMLRQAGKEYMENNKLCYLSVPDRKYWIPLAEHQHKAGTYKGRIMKYQKQEHDEMERDAKGHK